MAAANGHVDLLQRLIDHGAVVNLSNTEGNTPLHWACVNGQVGAVRVLMTAGASPSALNAQEMTPVDEVLIRNLQDVMDVINEFSGAAKTAAAEIDDIPDDAAEAGPGDDMAVDEGDDEGSGN